MDKANPWKTWELELQYNIQQQIGNQNNLSLGEINKIVEIEILKLQRKYQIAYEMSDLVEAQFNRTMYNTLSPLYELNGNEDTKNKLVKLLNDSLNVAVATEGSSFKGANKTRDAVWDMTKGGKSINGRWYSEHSLERMAPDTPQVRAELEARALEKGLKRGTEAFNKYVDPRGIPTSVVEDAIQHGARTAGKTTGTWVYESGDVRVIVNNSGGVVTVIPK